jgi:hypothetical protein
MTSKAPAQLLITQLKATFIGPIIILILNRKILNRISFELMRGPMI